MWWNDCFEKSFFIPDEDVNTLDLITDKPIELLAGRQIEYNDRWFRVYTDRHKFTLVDNRVTMLGRSSDSRERDVESRLTVLVFEEITDYKQLKKTAELTKPVVMVLMVDN